VVAPRDHRFTFLISTRRDGKLFGSLIIPSLRGREGGLTDGVGYGGGDRDLREKEGDDRSGEREVGLETPFRLVPPCYHHL